MERNFMNSIENLPEAPYWVIDPLPKQVPADGEGQYFAVERALLSHPQIDALHRKFTNILLKLNCYYDFLVSFGGGDTFAENPAPETLAETVARNASDGTGFVHILIPSETALLIFCGDDTCLTVCSPSDALLDLLRPLAMAEGLFLWQPPQTE